MSLIDWLFIVMYSLKNIRKIRGMFWKFVKGDYNFRISRPARGQISDCQVGWLPYAETSECQVGQIAFNALHDTIPIGPLNIPITSMPWSMKQLMLPWSKGRWQHQRYPSFNVALLLPWLFLNDDSYYFRVHEISIEVTSIFWPAYQCFDENSL
jgi:hypothetical protein